MSETVYDVLILGQGPAGLTAGLYAARARLNVLGIEKGLVGGELNNTEFIENYPGVGQVEGRQLAELFERDAKREGHRISTYEEVKSITKRPDGLFRVVTYGLMTGEDREYLSKAVIATAGGTPAKLGVPGEEFASYCAVCDSALPAYRNQRLFSIGAGSSSVEEGQYASRHASKVTILARGTKLRAEPVLLERLYANPKMEVIFDRTVEEILGDASGIKGVRVHATSNPEHKEVLDGAGVFIFIGFQPNNHILAGLGDLPMDRGGHIITGPDMSTPVAGLFVAGDLRSQPIRQVTTAASDGTIGAQAAAAYIESLGH